MEEKEKMVKSSFDKALVIIMFIFIPLSALPISIFFGDIWGIIIALGLVSPFFAYFYLKQNNGFSIQKKKQTALCVIFFLLFIWTVPQLFTIITIENEANQQIDNYSVLAENTLKGEPLLVSWNLTSAYDSGYLRTYHAKDKSNPARELANCCLNPFYYFIYDYYFHNSGYGKVSLLKQTGNCGEFSQAIIYLINSTMELPTRSVHFEGLDHEFPEVYVNDDWYIFDYTYTTQGYPVKAEDYAQYMNKKKCEESHCIADIKLIPGGDSLLNEHGFNTTIINVHLNKWDKPSFDSANVKIYTNDNNCSSPLVEQKNPDKNGFCNFSVRTGISYLIVAEYKEFFIFNYIGFKEITTMNSTEFVEITLHNTK